MATDILQGLGETKTAESKTSFTWSAQQTAFFDFIGNGKGNGVLEAGAGAGKTTTTLEGMRCFPGPCVYVAFNSDIAKESNVKIAEKGIRNGEARTTHSFGLSAIRKAFGRVDVDKEKGENLVREIVLGSADADPEPWERAHLAALKKAFGFARNRNAKTVDDVEDAVDEAGIEVPIRREEFAAQVLRAMEMSKARPGTVDFDDMLWLPVALGLQPEQVDAVFGDEIQDWNHVQIALMKSSLKPGGRFFGVGDPKQAIYTFRGAAAGAFETVVNLFEARTMPLNVTYRCAKRIVAEANEVFPGALQAADSAELGIVERVDGNCVAALARPGDAILSRTNRPLVTLCLKFMREGKRATIAGRDVGKRLTDLIKKSRAVTAPQLVDWIENWKTREVERLEKRMRPTDAVVDIAECLVAAAEGCKMASEVASLVERIFLDGASGDRVLLSSTHKAKGLEWDRVFVLSDTYLNKRKDKRTGEWVLPHEEKCLKYVAVSRAKRELYYVGGIR